jgi:hypothetical protein
VCMYGFGQMGRQGGERGKGDGESRMGKGVYGMQPGK